MEESTPKALGTGLIFFMICGSLIVGGLVGSAWSKLPISYMEFFIDSVIVPGLWIFVLVFIAMGIIPFGRVSISKQQNPNEVSHE